MTDHHPPPAPREMPMKPGRYQYKIKALDNPHHTSGLVKVGEATLGALAADGWRLVSTYTRHAVHGGPSLMGIFERDSSLSQEVRSVCKFKPLQSSHATLVDAIGRPETRSALLTYGAAKLLDDRFELELSIERELSPPHQDRQTFIAELKLHRRGSMGASLVIGVRTLDYDSSITSVDKALSHLQSVIEDAFELVELSGLTR